MKAGVASWARKVPLDVLVGMHRGAMLAYIDALKEGRFLTAGAALEEARMMRPILKRRLRRLERKQGL